MGSTHFKYQFFKSQQILSMNVELKQKALPEESAFCLRRVSSLWDSDGTNNDFRTQKKSPSGRKRLLSPQSLQPLGL
jgi:hypothetical protein